MTHEPAWFRSRIAFRPDGRLLLAVAPEVSDVRGWDPETGAEVPLPLRKEPAQALAFSPDGSLLALARDKEIEIWDTAGWRLRRRLSAHARSIDALAFAPNGQLASGSDDRSIRLWDAAQGKELLTLRGHLGGVTSLAFTADSRRLVSGDKEQTVKVWDVTHPPEGGAFQVTIIGTHGEWVANLAFADGQSLRVVDLSKPEQRYHARRWSVEEERQIADNPLLALGKGPTGVDHEVCQSADGRWLAVSAAGEPGNVRVCDADSTDYAGTIRTGAAEARPLALTADGRLVAYLGWGGSAGADDSRVELGVAANSGTITAHIGLPPGRTVSGGVLQPR